VRYQYVVFCLCQDCGDRAIQIFIAGNIRSVYNLSSLGVK